MFCLFVCLFMYLFIFPQERDRSTDPGSSGGFFGGFLKRFKTDMPKRGMVTCSYSVTSPILIPFSPFPFKCRWSI